MDDYNRKLLQSEFGQKDDYTKIKLGIVFFLLICVIVGSFFVHFKNIEVQEKARILKEQQIAYQNQRIEQYNQQQQALYQQQLDKYNQSIKAQSTPIVPIPIH